MTPQFLAVGWVLSLVPVLAAGGGELEVVFKGLNLGVAGLILYLLVTGALRRAGEVETVLALLAAETARADKEAASRERIQDAVLSDLSPALLKFGAQGEALVAAEARNADLMEKILDTVLSALRKPT